MIKYQVLCWREIPAQVRVYGGKRPVYRQMPEWFQQEIDRTAMIEGLVMSLIHISEPTRPY